MAQPIMVNQSTTLIQIDTSVFANSPHIVLLSNVNSPGSMITIRDTTGNAGQTNVVIVSTTTGVSYLDGGGPLNNIYTINQPYGYLTVTPKTPNIWGVINTFAFPDASASANLNMINVSSINISTIGYIQHALISTASISTLCTNNVYIRDNLSVGQSTIAHAGFYVCTIRSLENIIASSNIYAGSTISSMFGNFTSTLTVPYISTTDVWINGGLQTTSSISTSGPMFVGSSISTTGNLAVGASTFIQGQLTVLQAAFFGSSISTTGALNVGYEAILHSSLQVAHNTFIGGNVSTMSNVAIGASLSVMSSLYTQWDMYTTSSILAMSSISTLSDMNIGRNLSTLGKAFIGQELYTTSSILTTGTFSTLQDVNVRSNVSILGNLYVKGTVQFDNKSMSFQDILASSILTQYNISSMSSLIAGGGLYVTQSTILFGTVSSMSNFNIAGLLSTASTIVAGDSLIVKNTGYFGSSISTPSSIGVGGMLMVGGGVVLQSTLSTFGQAAFFSSVQIQGSLSVMSSIAAACNVFVGDTLVTSNLTLYGSTSISTLAITNTVDFGFNVSSSTLHHGLFSTSGAMNIGGLISTTNALIVGSTINTQFLQVQQTMSVFSNAGFAQDISARSSLFVNMSTVVNGGFWARTSATMADTRYTGAVVMDGSLNVGGTLTVGAGTTQTRLNGPVTIADTATFSNGIRVDSIANPKVQNRISNDTYIASVAFPLDGNTNNVNGRIFGSADTSMLITYNLKYSPFPSWASDYSGFSGTNYSYNIRMGQNTGGIVFNAASYPQGGSPAYSVSPIFQMMPNGNAEVFGNLFAKGLMINTTTSISPAFIDLRGGHSSTGTGGSNLITFQQLTGGGYRHFITSRHMNSVGANRNAIDFWLNNDTIPDTSSTAGTGNINMMSVTAAGLGINCNLPRYTLDVNGNINYSGDLMKNGVVFSGTPAGINSAGNVGINGALNTNYALTVNGAQSNTGTLGVAGYINTGSGLIASNDVTIGNTINNAGFLRFTTAFGGSYIQSSAIAGGYQPILFTGPLGANELMRLTTTGLGIGTPTPAYKLDVNGDTRLNGDVTFTGALTQNPVTLPNVTEWFVGDTTSGSADGTGSAARFNGISDIACDNLGNIYVTDTGNFTIRKITPGGTVSIYGGTNGVTGNIEGGPGNGTFGNLSGIWYGANSDIFITDITNKNIRSLTVPNSAIISRNNIIRNYATNCSLRSICVQTGSAQTQNAFITDNTYRCIYMFNEYYQTIITLAGPPPGSPLIPFADGIRTAAGFNDLQDICIDSSFTNLYVTDFGTIRKIVISTGEVTTLAGIFNGGTPTPSFDGTGAAARFYYPRSICIDPTNTYLYVMELSTSASTPCSIRRITISTGVVITLNLSTTFSSTTSAAICINPANTYLYVVSDNGNRIFRISLATVRPPITFSGNVSIMNGVLSKYASIANNGVFLRISDLDVNNQMYFTYNAKFANNIWEPDNSGYSGQNYSYFMNIAGAFSPSGFTFQAASYPTGTTNITSYIQNIFTILSSGDVTARGNVTAYSDVRAKENITTIDSALDKVMALRGVYYTRKDTPGPRHVGVIAQEVEAILPEVVITDSEGMKSVAYANIVAVLIEAIKEQNTTITALQSQVASQQSTINAILSKLNM